MGFPRGQTLQLGLAGTLADCGMAKIDRSITEKTAFLTKSEFNEVKKHTIYSYQMVQDTPLLRQEMKLAIFQHHERLDGSGYPRGGKMEEVSVLLSNTCGGGCIPRNDVRASISLKRICIQSN